MINYYSHTQKHRSVNGKTIEDNSESIMFKNKKGKKTITKNGKVVKTVELDKKDFDDYIKQKDKSIKVDDYMFKNAFDIIFDILEIDNTNQSMEDDNKKPYDLPQDLTPGTKTKISKLSTKQKSICDQIIMDFGLDPKKATKNQVEKIYNSLYKELEEKCKKEEKQNLKNHKECIKKLKVLSKNINMYNNPDNVCY